jgi:putative transposase
VGAFKSIVTKRINQIRDTPGAPVWQRNYYERIVRDERGLNAVRKYIQNNPVNWKSDTQNV